MVKVAKKKPPAAGCATLKAGFKCALTFVPQAKSQVLWVLE